MDRTDFKLGEKKYVCVRVKSCANQPFEITGAKYVLRCGEDEEATGDCKIEQWSRGETVLSALIEPKRKNAAYILEYTYQVPPEILKYEVMINVY